MTDYPCPVPNCSNDRGARDRLMCREHWYRVPKELRSEVWSAWRAGKLSVYLPLRQEAIDSVTVRHDR